MLLPNFGFSQKNKKIQKKNIKNYLEEIPKIIGARKGSWNVEKRPKLVEKV